MQNDILFDNIYIGHSVADAEKLAQDTFEVKKSVEKAQEEADKPKKDETDPLKSPSDLTFMDDPVAFAKEKVNLFAAIAARDPIEAVKNVPEVAAAVAVGLLIFIAIVVMAGVPKLVATSLDAKAAKIQGDLDEAARLRAEAEAMLAQIRQEKAEAEAQAADLLATAEADAKRLEAEAKARIEESTARRQALAERRIAQAEAEATQEVKAAAADLAAKAAQQILAARIAGAKTDPLLDQAIGQIGGKLN